jgi:hypothetical protein
MLLIGDLVQWHDWQPYACMLIEETDDESKEHRYENPPTQGDRCP